ncbi:unnamed protein product [Didymodactylos carnosus]|uniref:Phosphoglycerate mutase n=1 Tax=Didymodactylos carnosus TaxID=1234261 RepID=A0A813Y010_9BILA|nr:unnamed protein product [Didymodactylos carnosus]CAF3659914.1 unnamed protein product [Didymodactylos carnosus]
MYIATGVPTPVSFTPQVMTLAQPNQYGDIAAQQLIQQQHTAINQAHAAAYSALGNPPSNIMINNQSQQQQPNSQTQNVGLSSNTVQGDPNNYPIQQILLENIYNNVLMREKNLLYQNRIDKARKRLSDPVTTNYHVPLQPLLMNDYVLNSNVSGTNVASGTGVNPAGGSQNISIPTTNLQRVQSGHTLNRRRSVRYTKPSLHQAQPLPPPLRPINEGQKLFVIRHAERVDSTFGITWVDNVFDKNGQYKRLNLNLPKKMIQRRDNKDFLFDPPLTELGLVECKMVGEELLAQGVKISHVYSSPALRCVQTADKIIEGLNKKDEIPIRIEPCLFEFLKWYPVVPLKWPFLTIDELSKNGYHVDNFYKPFYPIESLRKDEDEQMYYTRSHFIITSILKNHELDGGNVLIVGHAPTLEVCTRQLTGGQPRVNDLKFLVLRIPFLSMLTISKQSDGTWRAIKPPIPPMKHQAVESFDWRFIR